MRQFKHAKSMYPNEYIDTWGIIFVAMNIRELVVFERFLENPHKWVKLWAKRQGRYARIAGSIVSNLAPYPRELPGEFTTSDGEKLRLVIERPQ